MSVQIVCIGIVEDLPNDVNLSWSEDVSDSVKDTLKSEGFDAEDLESFSNFLVKTETGDYTEIYGIKTNTPWISTFVYRFRKNGIFI